MNKMNEFKCASPWERQRSINLSGIVIRSIVWISVEKDHHRLLGNQEIFMVCVHFLNYVALLLHCIELHCFASLLYYMWMMEKVTSNHVIWFNCRLCKCDCIMWCGCYIYYTILVQVNSLSIIFKFFCLLVM